MSGNIDSVFRSRSLGVAATGVPDQYADGKAAKVWELYIGGTKQRSGAYQDWFCSTLRNHNCNTVLDVACGTGVDSIMLLDNGFHVVSTDASDKMLKYAIEERWKRRKDPIYEQWIIGEANWLSLKDDLDDIMESNQDDIVNGNVDSFNNGFDAVICLGNSFAHLLDFNFNTNKCGEIFTNALANFAEVLKPGGILIIDHRNYDYMLDTGKAPSGPNIYYQGNYLKDIKCSNLYVNGQPMTTTLDYVLDISKLMKNKDKTLLPELSQEEQEELQSARFRLSYTPHRLLQFTNYLRKAFGKNAEHSIYGDFKEHDKAVNPAYWIHIIKKPKQ